MSVADGQPHKLKDGGAIPSTATRLKRIVRVAEGTGLENQQIEKSPEFESPILCQIQEYVNLGDD